MAAYSRQLLCKQSLEHWQWQALAIVPCRTITSVSQDDCDESGGGQFREISNSVSKNKLSEGKPRKRFGKRLCERDVCPLRNVKAGHGKQALLCLSSTSLARHTRSKHEEAVMPSLI